MSAEDKGSNHALSAVQVYVRLLIATIAVISLAVIAYVYWHNSRLNSLENVANNYHLDAILRCTEIAEEVHRLLPARPAAFRRAAGDGLPGIATSESSTSSICWNSIFEPSVSYMRPFRQHRAMRTTCNQFLTRRRITSLT